jgi:hypothetical protein
MFNLAVLYRDRGDDGLAREWLFRSFAAGHAEPERTLQGWLNWYEDHRPAAGMPLLEEGVKRSPGSEALARALAIRRFKRKDCPGGFEVLAPFEAKSSDPNTLNSLALLQTCLGKREEAIALFDKNGTLEHPVTLPAGVTDLFVISHGWNNDADAARSLYRTFFTNFVAVATPNDLAGRSLAIVGVIWPSKKFDELLAIAGVPLGALGAAIKAPCLFPVMGPLKPAGTVKGVNS